MRARVSAAICACLAAAMAMLGGGVKAQAIYLGGEGGWTGLTGQRDEAAGLPTAEARYDPGFAAGARIGYEMGRWRFEAEYAYRRNALRDARLGRAEIAGIRGIRQSHAIMTNVLYDFDIGRPVSPHVGAGIGAVDVVDEARVNRRGRLLDDDDWRFGYQAIGGVRYMVSPKIAFDLDYRYLATTGATFSAAAAPAVRYSSGYADHTLMASFVYRLGPPPPPPPIVAPPAPAAPPAGGEQRVYLIFFDWDTATVSPRGMRVVRQAADTYKSGAPVRLEVTGYTDRSGSAGYNRRLSERRAGNVALALVRFGVPRDLIAVGGRGEGDPRVPTAAGAREPQNRRVEIVFP